MSAQNVLRGPAVPKGLHSVIKGLVYPAVAGAAFYIVLQRAFSHSAALLQPGFWLGALLLVYLSISFHAIEEALGYGVGTLVFDFAEMILIVLVYNWLGLVTEKEGSAVISAAAYWGIFSILVVGSVWSFLESRLKGLRLVVGIVALVVFAGAAAHADTPDSRIDWAVVVTLAYLLCVYLSTVVYTKGSRLARGIVLVVLFLVLASAGIVLRVMAQR